MSQFIARALLFGATLLLSPAIFADVVVVDTLADTSADGDTSSIAALVSNPGSDGLISLREAINAVSNTPGPDDIKFNVAGTIIINAAFGNLPTLNGGGTTIGGDNEITLDGVNLFSGGTGLQIASADNVIAGLKIVRFTVAGIRLTSSFATGNQIVGCEVGAASLSNGKGITMDSGASGNIIGGGTVSRRNIISGNSSNGVEIAIDCDANVVTGNYIGVNAAGTSALGNAGNGVLINAATNTTVGPGNVISGNALAGVRITNFNASGNEVFGNFIGVNAAGTAAIANAGSGVSVANAPGTNVGGILAGHRNVISGNLSGGVTISGAEAASCFVRGNFIGTNAAGTAVIANSGSGVFLSDGVPGCVIGGTSPAARNVICGNTGSAVLIQNGKNTIVQGNYLGVNVSGTAALPNGRGVLIQEDTSGTLIGGTNAGAGNVISGNTFTGVYIAGTGTDNSVVGNHIGVNAAGDAALGNGAQGVIVVPDVTNTIIGGTGTGRNIISGNIGAGIALDVGVTGVSVINNYIGLDATGKAGIGNGFFGIDIVSANSNILIGGGAGEGNVISGNAANGINVSALNGGYFYGNYIGTNADGSEAIPNEGVGISFEDSCTDILVGNGTADRRNVISGNTASGIRFFTNGSALTNILGNYIGTNAAGDAAIGNGLYGVDAGNTGNIVFIGAPDEGNVISGNAEGGLNLIGTSVVVKSNLIGLNAAGTAAVPNGEFGVAASRAGGGFTIGGAGLDEGNVISGNNGPGVFLFGNGGTNGVRLNRNSIFSNTGAGIERSLVADAGPDLPAFEVGAGTITLTNATPVSVVEVYVDDEDEGEVFVLAVVGTGAPQAISNALLIPYAGRNMTATATNLNQGTSLFSAPISLGEPELSTQPISRQVVEGRAFSLSVEASSALPLSIQWIFDDGTGFVDLIDGQGGVTGANSTTLNVAAATTGSGGIYACVLTNAAGSVTSQEAELTVVSESNGDLVVNTLSDVANAPDTTSVADLIAEPGADGVISLREALTAANSHIGPSLITFGVSGVIALENNLPDLGGDGGITILGEGIRLTSGSASTALNITSPDNVIDGLIIGGFSSSAINLTGPLASGNHIRACGIGTDGVNAFFNSSLSIVISDGANNNSIGVLSPGDKGSPNEDYRNIIANHGNSAIVITGAGTDNNIVAGNYLGVLADGVTGAFNFINVFITDGAKGTVVGGSLEDGTGNVMGGSGDGISVSGVGTDDTIIRGNLIGLGPDGATELMMNTGITVDASASGTLVGGSEPGEGNIIASCGSYGIYLGSGVTQTVLAGNTIGLAADGVTARPCGGGIYVVAVGMNNDIGLPDAGNIVSGNSSQGIMFDGVAGASNRVRGNIVGLSADQSIAVPNGAGGVVVSGSIAVAIGGSGSGDGNIIAGNSSNGIAMNDSSTIVFEGNFIGVNSMGASFPNSMSGIYLEDNSSSNTIGGTTAAKANIIASNGASGIYLEGSGVTNNRILGNYIGLLSNGTTARGNSGAGVTIDGGATGNDVGGSAAGEGNVIGANQQYGVYITGGSSSNRVQGNIIGRDATAGLGAGNQQAGILIDGGSTLNLIGVARSENCSFNPAAPPVLAGKNTIALNVGSGVVVSGASTANNRIRANNIFKNVGNGIDLVDGANNSVTAPSVTVLVSPTPGLELIRVNGAANSLVDVYADTEDEGELYLATCTIQPTGSVFFETNVPDLEGAYAFTAVTTTTSGSSSPFGSAGSLIADNTPPVVDVSGLGILEHECGTSFEAPGASISDNSGLLGATGVLLGDFNPDVIGTYTITYFAEDPSGNRAEAGVEINVSDNSDPELTLIGGAIIAWPCFTEYVDPGVTAVDLCADSNDIEITINDTDVDTSQPGVYEVVISASDGSNTVIETRSVVVDAVDCADVYVSPAGSNETGDGTELAPWRTIGFAMGKVIPFAAQSPVTLHAAAGNYPETVTMVENVRLLGEGQGVTKIVPTIGQLSTSPSVALRAAENSAIESLSIELPFEAPNTRMISIVDVDATVRNVELFGRQVPDSIGVFVRGSLSSETLVKDCRIRSVGIGLDIAFSAARFAFNDFENINGEAAIKISEPTGATPIVGDLGDLVTSGSNTFTNVSAVFIKSDNPAATSAQANSWENLDDEDDIIDLVDGAANVAQPLFTLDDDDKGLLAASLFVTVIDNSTEALVSGVNLTLVPTKAVVLESLTAGVYTATVAPGRYTIRARKSGFEEQVELHDVNPGINSITIRLGAAEGEGEGEAPVPLIHTGDTTGDGKFNLSELLRVVQLYNAGVFSCGSGDDGFQVGSNGGQQCQPHGADYAGGEPSWTITLSELLRIVQFFNLEGYYRCQEASEDGYCAGAP